MRISIRILRVHPRLALKVTSLQGTVLLVTREIVYPFHFRIEVWADIVGDIVQSLSVLSIGLTNGR
jgi:hypothetical protein